MVQQETGEQLVNILIVIWFQTYDYPFIGILLCIAEHFPLNLTLTELIIKFLYTYITIHLLFLNLTRRW